MPKVTKHHPEEDWHCTQHEYRRDDLVVPWYRKHLHQLIRFLETWQSRHLCFVVCTYMRFKYCKLFRQRTCTLGLVELDN